MKKRHRKIMKAAVAIFQAVIMIASLAALSSCGKSEESNAFTYYILKDDSNGKVYYEDYNQSLVVQYLNMLTWDTQNGGVAKDGSGEKVSLKFRTPAVSSSAADEIQLMFTGGTMTDLIDLSSISDSPKQLVTEHVLMEITEYVEQYMPNYVAYLNANPDVKKFVVEKDENGNDHYYALYQVADEPNDNFEGFMYRRDWLVDYAEVPTHVWDKAVVLADQNDFTSVQTDKIKYTSYFDAKAAAANGDPDAWKGWKESGVTKFTCSEGDDPDNDWQDNIIFPSGNTDPYYISDWEWMLEAFVKVTGNALTNSDKKQYALSLFQYGFYGTGDFYSSFGGGHPGWFVNDEGTVEFGAATSTMRAFIECMHEWYSRGYVDSAFETRTDDFWKINLPEFTSGKIAMGQYGMAYAGSAIRATSSGPENEKAMVWGCANPINDLYGEDENKFVTPDAMYSASKIGSATGISVNAADKNLAGLFTMLDWFYTEEGARLLSWGLTAEQYQELKAHGIEGKDYYEEWGITGGTTFINDAGKYQRIPTLVEDTNLQGAANGQRIMTTMQLNGRFDSGYKFALRHAMDLWRIYYNSTDITNYVNNLSMDDAKIYNDRYNGVFTYLPQNVPQYVKKGMTDAQWTTFLRDLDIRGYWDATDLLQAVVDRLG